MRVTALTIDNLRNLSQVRLQPAPGINLLHGDNGAGKTSVLEALLVLAKGRSFRTGTLASLLGPREGPLRVVAELEDDTGQAHRVGIERDREGWRGRLDGRDLTHVSEPARLFPLILMEPTSHQLVGGAPDARRRYLDWAVFHVKQGFLDDWRRYGRALKQRNAALRTGNRQLVHSLDPQVVTLGERLHVQREQVFERLAPVVAELLARLSPDLGELGLAYQPGWKGDGLAEALDLGLERDLEQGLTRQGPHRADISMRVEGKAVRDRLSRGEQKILAAALLLAQGRLFHDDGHRPLVLLDDLASEFDQGHLEQVIGLVRDLGAQVFVTGTDRMAYGFLQEPELRMFHVKHGRVEPDNGAEKDVRKP